MLFDITECPTVIREPEATHHRSGIIRVGAIEGLDVLKLKHVPLHKGFPNLLVGPRYEELIVVVCLLCQASGEVNWSL